MTHRHNYASNAMLLIISDWFKSNKLTLNVAKTSFILFTKAKHIGIKLYIDNKEIEEKSQQNI